MREVGRAGGLGPLVLRGLCSVPHSLLRVWLSLCHSLAPMINSAIWEPFLWRGWGGGTWGAPCSLHQESHWPAGSGLRSAGSLTPEWAVAPG